MAGKLVRRASALVILAGLLTAAAAQNNPSWPPPSIRAEQYGSAVVGGVIFGTVASIGVLVRLVPGNIPEDSPFTPELMLIPVCGYTAGATVGVCSAGDAIQAGGNGWTALVGTIAGSAVGGVLALTTRNIAWYGLSAALAPAGAVIGYNIVQPPAASADARFAAPALALAADQGGVALDFRPINIRF